MVLKAKKETSAPLRAETKAKAFEAKKIVLRHPEPQRKNKRKFAGHPLSDGPRYCGSKGSPNTLRKSILRRNRLDHYAIEFPLTTVKKIKDNNSLVFIINAKANKHQSKQDVKKLYDIDMTRVTSPIGPDGENAFIQVASSYDALDVAFKNGIFYTESG
nr:60S ribosomal protein L23a-like [Desmodus rotundus]